MERMFVAKTQNGKDVFVDTEGSNAATHLADTPGLLGLVKEVLENTDVTDENLSFETDMARVIGLSDLVATSSADEIVYAKRQGRSNWTRFVKNRQAEPTQLLTIILRATEQGYDLWSTWIGPKVPTFPGYEGEMPNSREYWANHALVWGNQAVQQDTEVAERP